MGFSLDETVLYVSKGYRGLVRGSSLKLGITGLRRLCEYLDGLGMRCEIGLAGNSLLNAANLNVMMSISNCDYYEYWRPLQGHQWGVSNEIDPNSRGIVAAPCEPGLGASLDEDWIQAHRIAVLSSPV